MEEIKFKKVVKMPNDYIAREEVSQKGSRRSVACKVVAMLTKDGTLYANVPTIKKFVFEPREHIRSEKTIDYLQKGRHTIKLSNAIDYRAYDIVDAIYAGISTSKDAKRLLSDIVMKIWQEQDLPINNQPVIRKLSNH